MQRLSILLWIGNLCLMRNLQVEILQPPILGGSLVYMTSMCPSDSGVLTWSQFRTISNHPSADHWGWWQKELLSASLQENRKQDCQWLICLSFSKTISLCEAEHREFSRNLNKHKAHAPYLCQNMEIFSTYLKGSDSSHSVKSEVWESVWPEKQWSTGLDSTAHFLQRSEFWFHFLKP